MSRLSSSVRKRAIAQAALTLLARDGVGGFTTSTLARRVGVSEAALFRHFPNLDAILDAAVTELEILLFPEDAAPDEGAPLDDLRSLLGRRAAMLRDRPGVLRILFSHELGRAGTPRTAQRVVALRRRSMAQLTSYLQRAVDDGLVREDVTVKELVSIVYGMILSLVFDVDRAVPGGFESA
ncbi:MAG: TetR/AcrR family transcriptional regulator, partial [Myxococcales bacterium]|nr:TetR/AcrR family transcriptional regulator [Myxococcales bacterium]